jgi:hypothetical protein
MFVILWEFEVKPGSADRFQVVYGSDGPWVRLFRGDPRYRQTLLLRDPARPLFFFTLDFWESESVYDEFLLNNKTSYEALDRATEGLTDAERLIGRYNQLPDVGAPKS